jgi:hypothetical protein
VQQRVRCRETQARAAAPRKEAKHNEPQQRRRFGATDAQSWPHQAKQFVAALCPAVHRLHETLADASRTLPRLLCPLRQMRRAIVLANSTARRRSRTFRPRHSRPQCAPDSRCCVPVVPSLSSLLCCWLLRLPSLCAVFFGLSADRPPLGHCPSRRARRTTQERRQARVTETLEFTRVRFPPFAPSSPLVCQLVPPSPLWASPRATDRTANERTGTTHKARQHT